jgi:diguanylate cyclase (GGDEF)-like protein
MLEPSDAAVMDAASARHDLVPEQETYVGPRWWSITVLREAHRRPGLRRLLLLGLATNAVAVLTGVMNVHFDWNGVPVSVGPLRFELTIYPPLLISVLAAVWIGPMWGIVPAYLANLASAVWSGIPLPTAGLFALAGAIETVILWGSMVTLNVSPDLPRWRDLRRFAEASLIAPATSSLAVLIWNTSLGHDFAEGQRIWRGWVVGDFLQLVLVAAPLLRWLGVPARAWVDRQFGVPPRLELTYTRAAAFAVAVFALMGGLVFLGIGMLQASLELPPGTRTLRGELLEPRLLEVQLFLGLLAIALIVTTGVFSRALARIGERQRALARRDSLTGCFNRRAFDEFFRREADRSRRLGQGLALVFVDVDHFKDANDHFGHEAGDRILQQLAARLQGVVRDTDLIFRWGGEEFVLLLAHTSADEAPALAERVRAAVAERPFAGTGTHPPVALTVSLGTVGSRDVFDADLLLARADEACYRAKTKGRNRVEHDLEPSARPEAPAAGVPASRTPETVH